MVYDSLIINQSWSKNQQVMKINEHSFEKERLGDRFWAKCT